MAERPLKGPLIAIYYLFTPCRIGFEVVVNGLIDIFPSLEDCGRDGGWGKISGRIAKIGRAHV